MVGDEIVEPLLHLLGGLGEALLVERVHQHDLVVDQRGPDRRTAIMSNVNSRKKTYDLANICKKCAKSV